MSTVKFEDRLPFASVDWHKGMLYPRFMLHKWINGLYVDTILIISPPAPQTKMHIWLTTMPMAMAKLASLSATVRQINRQTTQINHQTDHIIP